MAGHFVICQPVDDEEEEESGGEGGEKGNMKGKEAEEFGGGDYGVGPRWAGGSCTAKQVVILNFFYGSVAGTSSLPIENVERRAPLKSVLCTL